MVTSPLSRPSDAAIAIGKPLGGLLQIANSSDVERHANADVSNAGRLWPLALIVPTRTLTGWGATALGKIVRPISATIGAGDVPMARKPARFSGSAEIPFLAFDMLVGPPH